MPASVKPGQKYRDPSGAGGPQIITVDSIEGDQVHGSYSPEEGPPGMVGANTWHISTFETLELVSGA